MAAVGLIHSAQSIAQTGARVDLCDSQATRSAGIGISGINRDAFLKGQHIRQAGAILQRVKKTLLYSAGVTKDLGDAVSQKLIKNSIMACSRHSSTQYYSATRENLGQIRPKSLLFFKYYQPERFRSLVSTSTKRSPNSCEHCSERAVMNG